MLKSGKKMAYNFCFLKIKKTYLSKKDPDLNPDPKKKIPDPPHWIAALILFDGC